MVSQKNTQGKWRQKEKEGKDENTKLGIQKQILKESLSSEPDE